MQFMAPVFLPINLSRVNTLRERYSDTTVAGIINDENGTDFTPQDIASFAKVGNVAAGQMLVSQKGMNALLNAESGPQPA